MHYILRSKSLLNILPEQSKGSIIDLFIKRVIKWTVLIIKEYHLPTSYIILVNILLSRLTP
jgi:hypothetical protein